MDFIIIAKSTAGFGVVVGGDVVAEFETADQALTHATELREAAATAGRATDVVDLSEADTGHPLLKRPDIRI